MTKIIFIIIFLTGCTSQQWNEIAAVVASASGSSYPSPHISDTSYRISHTAASRYSGSYESRNVKLMLFGGKNHKTYLGCISCSEYDTDSVFNRYGAYGSKYSSTSIYNSYSDYGSQYTNYSPCNQYASHPPIIIDDDGDFYGALTVNPYNPEATTDGKLLAWLTGVCGTN
ncbi:hypothetical protein [Microbulbifer sp. TYP-18]|uniref:hypothetical protein n=1 Tax=Microbulbifer sp. TYP-18 TaxID=3230024 RepID=UPI0034C67754